MINSVCMFGDSVSKGVVFDSVMKKYILLKDSFANMIKGSANISVKNYSRFGCTITKGLDILRQHKNEISHYDYTALEFGGNDCDFNWAEISAAPDAPHLPKTPVGEFERKYGSMISEINQNGSHPVLLSLPPLDAKRYFTWISRGLNAGNILRWLGDVERIYRWHEMYNLAIYRLAKDYSVPLIDISSAFLETMNYQKLICEDGIHPNKEGHKLICRTISDTIKQYQKAYA